MLVSFGWMATQSLTGAAEAAGFFGSLARECLSRGLAATGMPFWARAGVTLRAAISVLAARSGLSGLLVCDLLAPDRAGLLLDAGLLVDAALVPDAGVVRGAVVVAVPLADGTGLFVARALVGVADPAVPEFAGVAELLAGSPLRASVPVPVPLPETALGLTVGEADAGAPGLGEGSVPGPGDFEPPELGELLPAGDFVAEALVLREVPLGLTLLLALSLPVGATVVLGVAVALGVPLALGLVLGLGVGLLVGPGFFVPVGVGEGEGVGLGVGSSKSWHC